MISAPGSLAHIWGVCSGALELIPLHERKAKTQAQREGDAMHWVGEQMIRSCLPGATATRYGLQDFLGQPDPAGTIVTEEMYRYAAEYAETVLAQVTDQGLLDKLRVEFSARCTRIHGLNQNVIDAWAYDAQTHTLWLWDAKFGHRDVEAVNNLQLVTYAAAIMEHLGIDGVSDQTLKVKLFIIQPRCFYGSGPVKTWEVLGSDLRGPVTTLSTKAHEGASGKCVLTSGPQCVDCPAAYDCPAARKAAMSAFEFVVYQAAPEEMSHAALGYEKKLLDYAAKAIKSRATAVDAEIEHRIVAQGAIIPGFRPHHGTGQRAWAVGVQDVKDLGDMIGVSLIEEKPVTPAEAERRIKAAKVTVDDAVISAYTHRPSTGLKIVPDDGTKATTTFKG